MTYEEYKNKNTNKRNILKVLISKLFTIVIFVMVIIIISNYNIKFRNFLINDVLNSSMDFSKFNKIVDKVTKVFKKEVLPVSLVDQNVYEKYLDGVKYKIGKEADIYAKDSGIVTYIGVKEGYNNTIIIQQSNGYYAWYGNVKESIKLYDYIESGIKIGTSSDEYYYVLLHDNKPVDQSEY